MAKVKKNCGWRDRERRESKIQKRPLKNGRGANKDTDNGQNHKIVG